MLSHAVLAVVLTGQVLAQRPSTAPAQPDASACAGDADTHLARLRGDGHTLLRAIRSNDTKTILDFFGDSVSLGADHLLTHSDVEQQLTSKSGIVYVTLFDTARLKALVAGTVVETTETTGRTDVAAHIRSLHDYFVEAERVAIDVQAIDDIPRTETTPLWALLSFRWRERPPKGVYDDPIFVCTRAGWKFATFFNVP